MCSRLGCLFVDMHCLLTMHCQGPSSRCSLPSPRQVRRPSPRLWSSTPTTTCSPRSESSARPQLPLAHRRLSHTVSPPTLPTTTTRYSLLGFLPVALLQQFTGNVANVYFLVVYSLYCWPLVSPLQDFTRYSGLFLLCFVVFLSLVIEFSAFMSARKNTPLLRMRQATFLREIYLWGCDAIVYNVVGLAGSRDSETNGATAWVLPRSDGSDRLRPKEKAKSDNHGFVPLAWRNIVVGSVVKGSPLLVTSSPFHPIAANR